jgi:site-specific DNA-methyltransferase (adenine-specific)
MFPEELPRRLIKMFSFPGETALDPFAGSGTTARAAKTLGRNSVSYEINPDFIPIIKEKIDTADGDGELVVAAERSLPAREELDARMALLPYRFVDARRLDGAADIKGQSYGSRVDAGGATGREGLFSVRRALSAELVELGDGTVVRLLGIKEDPAQAQAAKDFLAEKFKGRRVFMKYDEAKRDGEGRPLVYLYLDNKTFINAHLLKRGYARVDGSVPFGLLEKFTALAASPARRPPEKKN